VAWLDDDRVLVGFDQGRNIEVIDLRDGSVSELRGHTDAVWAVGVDATNDRVFTGGEDGQLRIWDLETLRAIGPPLIGAVPAFENDPDAAVREIRVSQDGTRVTVLHGSEVVVWDVDEAVWRDMACHVAGRGPDDVERESFPEDIGPICGDRQDPVGASDGGGQ